VSRAGPGILEHVGISGIWGAIIPAVLLVGFVWWLSRDLSEQGNG
jgi:hypothetical protein